MIEFWRKSNIEIKQKLHEKKKSDPNLARSCLSLEKLSSYGEMGTSVGQGQRK
jgi:hypothetical protein